MKYKGKVTVRQLQRYLAIKNPLNYTYEDCRLMMRMRTLGEAPIGILIYMMEVYGINAYKGVGGKVNQYFTIVTITGDTIDYHIEYEVKDGEQVTDLTLKEMDTLQKRILCSMVQDYYKTYEFEDRDVLYLSYIITSLDKLRNNYKEGITGLNKKGYRKDTKTAYKNYITSIERGYIKKYKKDLKLRKVLTFMGDG